jgi:hypothetical protein
MTAPRDPLAFDFGLNFKSSGERVRNERERRLDNAARGMPYHHAFLDDYMRQINPHDLILIGARTGAGKTELARAIAANNAASGRRAHYFALEAEENEIEMRTKFTVLSDLVYRYRISIPGGFNYPDWYCGRLEQYVGEIDAEATAIVSQHYKSLHTYYKGSRFAPDDIRKMFLAVQDETDLIILDHLHYVDIDDDNENRGFKLAVQTIRDIAIAIGKPVVLVVHLRKADINTKGLVPTMDDVHGSSDTGKISTNAVMLAPASESQLERSGYKTPKGIASTFVGVSKYRVGGATPLVALCSFDWRRRSYADHYTLGREVKGKFEPLGTDEVPPWAHRHQPLSVPMAAGAEA